MSTDPADLPPSDDAYLYEIKEEKGKEGARMVRTPVWDMDRLFTEETTTLFSSRAGAMIALNLRGSQLEWQPADPTKL